ncbi:MAG: tRNA (adenosine(37)-N6)-threonylcarbamoyltransferase complex transferase subunit TsaD [Candidatus Limnocylindrus sp.]
MSTRRLILAVESSCDESAVALVREGGEVVAERVASQRALHAVTGGVIPEVAAREHHHWVPRLLEEVLSSAEGASQARAIDAVAVTAGPGLVGSLLVGAGVAAAWAWGRGLPIVPTNHLEGHFRAAWLHDAGLVSATPQLPAIGLIVSGGHTLIVLVRADGTSARLGGTIDDAAGEAFDKIARLLGLPYPGGAALSALAATAASRRGGDRLPVARTEGEYDVSFSGVKTAAARMALAAAGVPSAAPGRAAALHAALRERPVPPEAAATIAAAAETAIVTALLERVEAALLAHPGAGLVVGGGVASNGPLRTGLAAIASKHQRLLSIPPVRWCTDNAAMIGAAAHAALMEQRVTLQDPAHGLTVRASWPFGAAAAG